MNTSLKLSKKLSFGEEIANSVTHAVGAVIMLILLPISSTYSYEAHGFLSSFGVSIFVISLFLMFLSSTIYHSMAYGSTHKYVLRIIDHSMIYVAIAGSYTPVVLTLMNNWFGYLIIAIQWGTTIFGTVSYTHLDVYKRQAPDEPIKATTSPFWISKSRWSKTVCPEKDLLKFEILIINEGLLSHL